MAESLTSPLSRLTALLVAESYGSKILCVRGGPPSSGVTLTWDGTQTGGNETAAQVIIDAFTAWGLTANEVVGQYPFTAEVVNALAVALNAVEESTTIPAWAADLLEIQADLVIAARAAGPPINSVPGAQACSMGSTLTFNSGGSNLISIADTSLTGSIQVNLSVTSGTLTLSTTTGLTFLKGDGTTDQSMIFSGTLANCNSALDGLIFTTPAAPFQGISTLRLYTNDLGHTAATPVEQFDTDTVAITVTATSPVTISVAGTYSLDDYLPAGTHTLQLEVWGGGSGGAAGNNSGPTYGGIGGQGGAYAIETSYSYTTGAGDVITVGAGGTGGTGNNGAGGDGGDTHVKDVTLATTRVKADAASGGFVGSTAASTGDTKYAGGSNGSASGNNGGGGGSSAGTGATGNNGSGVTGGTAPTGGAAGGTGGTGIDAAGTAGSAPGAGGGAGGRYSTGANGGAGGAGKITITW